MATWIVPALIAAMTVAAVLIAFRAPRSGELPFSASDIELMTGPRSIRTTLSCLVMLLLMVAGTWAAFVEDSAFANDAIYIDVLLGLLLIASAVPEGRVRRLVVRLMGVLLAVWAALQVAYLLADLWSAAASGATPLVTRDWSSAILVRASTDPLAFWYSVAGRAFLVGVLLYALREYVLRHLANQQPRARSGGGG